MLLNALIIGYLFLGGLGSGAFLVLTAMSFLSPRKTLVDVSGKRFQPHTAYQRLFSMAYVACLLVLLLGILCLFFDLGRPEKILLLITRPHFSVMSIGAYALALLTLCTVFLCITWLGYVHVRLWIIRAVSMVGLAASVVAMVYTAVLLQSFPTMGLWRNPLVLVLFILSSLSTGIAFLYIVAQLSQAATEFKAVFRRLLNVDSLIMVLEVLTLGILLFWGYRDAAQSDAIMNLMQGLLAPLFWAGLVIGGLAIPATLNVASTKFKIGVASVASPLLVLVGGLCLRVCIVAAVY